MGSNISPRNNCTHHPTDDGSFTIYSDLYGAHYHSTHGAIQESMHVFIDYGLKSINKNSIGILEFGFGTGLNAFLTALHVSSPVDQVDYHSLELHPLAENLINELNYPNNRLQQDLFADIHQASWNKWIELRSNFSLKKELIDFVEFQSQRSYDIIYYDAFAPSTQSHLWTEEMMQLCYEVLHTDGILVSYYAKGSFKRALKSVGFDIEPLPGPPGKREMTRAIKR